MPKAHGCADKQILCNGKRALAKDASGGDIWPRMKGRLVPVPDPTIAILLPAAGASGRMGGRDKLMEPVDGEPVLRRIARQCVASEWATLVTLPMSGPYSHARFEALSGLPVHPLPIADALEGLSASLRAGVAFAEGADGLMVVMADMPDIDLTDLQLLCAWFAQDRLTPVRATNSDGTPGHPVIIPHRMFSQIAGLRGDIGARALLDQERVNLCQLPGLRATTDLDTAGDWSAWRSRR